MVGRTVNSPSKELGDSKASSDIPSLEMEKVSKNPNETPENGELPIEPGKEFEGMPQLSMAEDISSQSATTNNASEPELAELSPTLMNLTQNLITTKVKDFAGHFGAGKAETVVVCTETTFGEFFGEVARRFQIEIGEFDLIYQDRSYTYNLSGFTEDEKFDVIGITPSSEKVYWISMDVLQQSRKRKSRPTDYATDADMNSTEICADGMDFGSSKRDFVGLKNRTMTCYLNSFLQALWFTPEFRNAVYNFVYEPQRLKNKKSLCLPLQRLFLQQQLSIRDVVETDELIKTFGWEDRETWFQHDVEELCSLFMENLSAEFRGTPMEGIIEALYFGTLHDYVKCLECGMGSQRTDDFLVIPLPIKNFGSSLAHPTLEAALNSFVAPEVLDGLDKYNCGQCLIPCRAHKGFKFNSLPYILTIQLKRFEYDSINFRRYKLNDRVAFPFILDMNPYVENPSPDRREDLKVDLLKPASLKEGGMRTTHSRPSIPLQDPEADATEESQCLKVNTGKLLEELVKAKGPEIYQLFSVMVHTGGVNSGHYYTYIFDFEREKWFRCDDSIVRAASISDIEGAYGGKDKELTSAYMVLYRRFDPQLNMLPYYLEEMPAHMQEMWKVTEAFDQHLHEEDELAKNTVSMLCYSRESITGDFIEKTLQIPKTLNMADVAWFIYEEIHGTSDSDPAKHNIRVVRYDKDLSIMENSFEGLETKSIVSALKTRPAVTKNETFLIEIKSEGADFLEYSASDLVFRTHLVNPVKGEVYPTREVHANCDGTVADLKANVLYWFPSNGQELFMIAHSASTSLFSPVGGDKYPLNLFKFGRVTDLYILFGTEENMDEVLLNFVEKYTKAEVTKMHIEVPPEYFDKPSDDGKVAENKGKGESGKPKPKEITALEISDGDESIELATKAASIIINDEVRDNLPVGDSTPSQNARDYFIKFTNRSITEHFNILEFTLRIDPQTPLDALSRAISSLIWVEEENFVIYKVESTEKTELRRMTERISTLKPFDRLDVKLERRLKDGESRLSVYLLNIGNMEKPSEFLNQIVVTLSLTVDDLRNMIHQKCEFFQTDVAFDRSRLRIRKKLRACPSKIMRKNAKLQDIFSAASIHTGELFVQVTDAPCALAENTYSMLYRHWHPSTGVLDPPVEITIFHDYTNDLEELIVKKIKETLGLGDEVELEAAKPEGSYPWDIQPRLIQDLTWFSLLPPGKKSLYIYSDELALFVRDKNEVSMDFEDLPPVRTQTVIRTLASLEAPRRETGLKINLSNSPTKP